ncbi:hypothetical protein ACJX0J_035493, partial [Zea mays]
QKTSLQTEKQQYKTHNTFINNFPRISKGMIHIIWFWMIFASIILTGNGYRVAPTYQLCHFKFSSLLIKSLLFFLLSLECFDLPCCCLGLAKLFNWHDPHDETQRMCIKKHFLSFIKKFASAKPQFSFMFSI